MWLRQCLAAWSLMLTAHAQSAALQKRRKSGGRKKKVQLEDGETLLVDPDDPAFMPGAQKEQARPVLVLPPDADNIPGLKPETIEETEKRIEAKTVKGVLFQVCVGAPCIPCSPHAVNFSGTHHRGFPYGTASCVPGGCWRMWQLGGLLYCADS